jgi:hypothetical protein
MPGQVTVRHQVAIAGLVSDANTSGAIERALVQISSAPDVFTDWLALRRLQFGASWNGLPSRPDLTYSRSDGLFYFLDLPDGTYTVSVSLPGGTYFAYFEATSPSPATHRAISN